MKKILLLIMILLAGQMLFARYNPAIHDYISDKQLEGFVKEAYYFAKIYGKASALKEYTKKGGLFHRGELYIFAYDMSGKVLGHGEKAELIGRNLYDLKDPKGVTIIKSMISIAKTKGQGAFNYMWFYPKTDEIRKKNGYVQKIDNNWWIGSGYYPK